MLFFDHISYFRGKDPVSSSGGTMTICLRKDQKLGQNHWICDWLNWPESFVGPKKQSPQFRKTFKRELGVVVFCVGWCQYVLVWYAFHANDSHQCRSAIQYLVRSRLAICDYRERFDISKHQKWLQSRSTQIIPRQTSEHIGTSFISLIGMEKEHWLLIRSKIHPKGESGKSFWYLKAAFKTCSASV